MSGTVFYINVHGLEAVYKHVQAPEAMCSSVKLVSLICPCPVSYLMCTKYTPLPKSGTFPHFIAFSNWLVNSHLVIDSQWHCFGEMSP